MTFCEDLLRQKGLYWRSRNAQLNHYCVRGVKKRILTNPKLLEFNENRTKAAKSLIQTLQNFSNSLAKQNETAAFSSFALIK